MTPEQVNLLAVQVGRVAGAIAVAGFFIMCGLIILGACIAWGV